MEIAVKILYAFTRNGAGGNPAGVVLNSDKLTNTQKQAIAAKTGFSETAFVSKSSVADFKLEFFTPNRQIAHCGHATIATFTFLKKHGYIDGNFSSKETIDGLRNIYFEGDLAFMEQRAPKYMEADVMLDEICRSLGISPAELMPGLKPYVVNTGENYLVVPVKSAELLAKIQPDMSAIHAVSDYYDLIGYYVFSTETTISKSDATARMFAPRYAIPEESATGMGAGPLACFLREKMGFSQTEFLIEQGYFMEVPSPSELQVKLTLNADGTIEKLAAGGSGRESGELYIYISEEPHRQGLLQTEHF
jgi:PhzF family phenazine biosynthesis protein